MAKKKFDTTNLNRISTDPIMDQTIHTIVGTSSEKEHDDYVLEETDFFQPDGELSTIEKDTKAEAHTDHRTTYNYRKTELDIDGVGVIEKVISEKGKIIGRPNTPIKEKKKPITLTLRPELYDMVKEKAASDHRTTSEYLAMIIEDYLSK